MPFGAKPTRASAIICVSILLIVYALAGIAKSVRASVSISIDYRHANEHRSPCWLGPKRPGRAFWALVPNRLLLLWYGLIGTVPAIGSRFNNIYVVYFGSLYLILIILESKMFVG